MKKCNDDCCPNGETLNILAVSFANAMAQCLTDEEMELLAVFLTVLADALALIPSANSLCAQKKLMCKCDKGAIENKNGITPLDLDVIP